MTAPTWPLIPAPVPTGAVPAPDVRGIDISLTGTAVAGDGWTERVPSTGKRNDSLLQRHRRMTGIAETVLTLVGTPHLAVVEGPSYSSIGGSAWDRGGLWWLIVDGLLARDIPTAVMPPMCRAKYATGKGNSGKKAVQEAARHRYGLPLPTDDEADACVLRAAGFDWLGHPLVPVPDTHRSALLSCRWPDLTLEVAR